MQDLTPLTSVGARLAELRKARGFTQTELGEAVSVSQRVITYYERETAYPPSHLATKLAHALNVTTDQLLGHAPVKAAPARQDRHLWRKLQQAESLPPTDRKVLLKVLDGLVAKNRGG